MSLRVATNVAALTSHRRLLANDEQLNQSLKRLSSGLRIGGASDDAAGMAIGEKMLGQINGLGQAQRNVQDGISLLQTAEGALGNSQSILQRMRVLAVQSVNDTLTLSDRANISVEIMQLASEIDRIATNTEFNTKKLLDGSLATQGMTFIVGATGNQSVNVTLATAGTSALMVNGGNSGGIGGSSSSNFVAVAAISPDLTVDSAANASLTLEQIDQMLEIVSLQRSSLGASINRLQVTISNLGTQAENAVAARSRIMDQDMATEAVTLSKSQLLSQSAMAMLSQANQSPKSVLALLQG